MIGVASLLNDVRLLADWLARLSHTTVTTDWHDNEDATRDARHTRMHAYTHVTLGATRCDELALNSGAAREMSEARF